MGTGAVSQIARLKTRVEKPSRWAILRHAHHPSCCGVQLRHLFVRPRTSACPHQRGRDGGSVCMSLFTREAGCRSVKKPRVIKPSNKSPPPPQQHVEKRRSRLRQYGKTLSFLSTVAAFAWRTTSWVLGSPFRCGLWIWHNPFKSILSIFKSILNVGAFLGAIYLVYDSYFQTEATISSVASDAQDPFYFPFVVANNSHIFSIRNVKWECKIDYVINDKYNAIRDSRIGGSGSQEEVLPNGFVDIDCDGFNIPPPITDAKISIALSYKTTVFRTPFYDLEFSRTPAPTIFSWYGRTSNPQWIKGVNKREKPSNLPPRLRFDPGTGRLLTTP